MLRNVMFLNTSIHSPGYSNYVCFNTALTKKQIQIKIIRCWSQRHRYNSNPGDHSEDEWQKSSEDQPCVSSYVSE